MSEYAVCSCCVHGETSLKCPTCDRKLCSACQPHGPCPTCLMDTHGLEEAPDCPGEGVVRFKKLGVIRNTMGGFMDRITRALEEDKPNT